jgi:thiamine-monophosphate kinase
LYATVSSLGERALIARLTARLAMPPWVVVGPGDDAAVIEPERGALEVVTTDAQVEGIHFDRRFVPPDGHRTSGVGGEPERSWLRWVRSRERCCCRSRSPTSTLVSELDAMLDGLLALAAVHRTVLIGGNITRTTGPLVLDVTAMGTVKRRRVLTRAGSEDQGDEVYVTGTLGDAAVGLRSLRDGRADAAPRHASRARRAICVLQPRVRAVSSSPESRGVELYGPERRTGDAVRRWPRHRASA